MTRSNQRRAAAHIVDLNRFAEALADGLTVNQAAVRIGKSESACRNYLISLRRALGPQAV